MKNTIIFILLLSLTACANFSSKPDLPIILTESTTEYIVPEVNIDQYLLSDCDLLNPLGKINTFNDVLLVTKDNVELYTTCRDKHSALVKVLKSSLNIK
jgi:hypothetical protein